MRLIKLYMHRTELHKLINDENEFEKLKHNLHIKKDSLVELGFYMYYKFTNSIRNFKIDMRYIHAVHCYFDFEKETVSLKYKNEWLQGVQ